MCRYTQAFAMQPLACKGRPVSRSGAASQSCWRTCGVRRRHRSGSDQRRQAPITATPGAGTSHLSRWARWWNAPC